MLTADGEIHWPSNSVMPIYSQSNKDVCRTVRYDVLQINTYTIYLTLYKA